jgi:uncharacterized membrane protein YdbT with pleckstrin-like domain/ribosomal protein L40E
MFCNKCGAQNSDEAVYCHKCGFQFGAEEETRLRIKPRESAEENEELEKQIFSIRPTLIFVKVGYVATVMIAFLLVALLSTLDTWLKLNVSPWIFVLLGLSLLLVPAFYHLKRNVVRYTLTDSKIEIDEGFISQKTRNVPLRTIQDVTVSSTIPQRMLGFGDLIIENASENGGRIVLKNVNSPKKYADILLKQMRQLNK